MRTVHLEGVDNVRDLGGVPVDGGRVVAPGLLFRGSALVGITDDDCRVLFDELGVRCVVDLRTGWEREAKPDALPDDVEYQHIPFYDLEKVGIEYTEPAAGTKLIGRDVACDPDLFYRSLSNELTVRQMRTGLHYLLDCATCGRPAYFHCSGGKDRAGIMALLLLTALGASHDAILDDYLITNIARDKNYQRTYERFLRLADGNEPLARELTESHRARPQNLQAFYEAVAERYGSTDAFMRNQMSMDDEALARVRGQLTVPA